MTSLFQTPSVHILADEIEARLAEQSEAMPAVTMADLWARVCDRDTVISLSVSRALRSDERLAKIYRSMLQAQALAYSAVARAASDQSIERRLIGDIELRLLPSGDGLPAILVISHPEAMVPHAVAVSLEGRFGRINLPESVDGVIQVALGTDLADADFVREAFGQPACEVFVL
jgi:hypothetical protein